MTFAVKVLALLAIVWLAAASGKEKRGPNLKIKKLKPESKKPVKIPDWGDIAKNRTNRSRSRTADGEDFRLGGGGMISRQCNCRTVIWGTDHLQNINKQCSRTCQYWWLNGKRDMRKVMIVKVVVSTKLVFYFRVKSDSTQLSWCQAKKKKNNKYVCQSPWQTVLLVKIDMYLYSSIIQWESESAKLWGFVNPSNGMISCFGYPNELTYFINRMFINYLIKTYVIGKRGLVVTDYIIWWHKKWQKFEVPEAGMWLIPTWLPMVQRVMHWRVVIYQSITYVEYIGPNLNEDIMEIWIWTNKGLFKYRVRIDTIYIYWQRRSKGKWVPWTKVLLNTLYKKLKLTIVRWKTFSGEWMTGLCNSNGDIIAFMDSYMELYRLTINRLYLQHFILNLIKNGYRIKRYKIIWEGKVIISTKRIVVTELLIPTWLPPEQCKVVWKVIKYESKVVIIYIGGEVRGPSVIDCSDYVGKGKCEEAIKEPGQVNVPEIDFPDPLKVPDNCKLFNENGRCVDVINRNPDGYCRCRERCTCVDPFDRRNLGWGDPIFPGPLIPGGIIHGSCGGPSCPGPNWTPPLGMMAGAALIDSPNMTPGGGDILFSPQTAAVRGSSGRRSDKF